MFILLVLVLAACLVQVAWAADEAAVTARGNPQLKKVDVNPDFTAFLGEKTAGRWATSTAEGKRLGFIPPTVSLQHLQGNTLPQGTFVTREGVARTAPAALPSKFDLRTTGKVTSVKDQGTCGDCWAYATYGSLESFFMPATTLDFSEAYLDQQSGFDVGSCKGGNQFMSTAYLSRWDGPVLETNPVFTDVVDHVQDVVFIPKRSSSLDNTNLKNAISSTGAVYSAFYYTSSSYNPANYAYYYSGRSTSNHAITLVGWDDTFSRTKFRPSAPGNGAFIAKNSWGPNWGQSGYFYISYYDRNIGSDNAAFTGEPLGNYNREYQYDPLGWVTSYGCNANTGWFANIFTSVSAGNLAAVSFYSATTNSPYVIRVYTNPTNGPASGTLARDVTGTVASPGYHTVKITSPVTLNAGDTFSVVVKLMTPGYKYPIPAEQAISGYSGGATSSPGESYVSCEGNSWTDLTTIAASANVCLKAFAI